MTNPFRPGLWIRHRIGAIGATASRNVPMMPVVMRHISRLSRT